MNNASGTDQEGVGPLFKSVAKASSMSLFVLAVTTSICRPMAAAAVCNSVTKGSVVTDWSGLTSTANARGSGSNSCNMPSRFAPSSDANVADPGDVAAGPVEAGDEADFDRIRANDEDDRNRRGRCLGRERRGGADRS